MLKLIKFRISYEGLYLSDDKKLHTIMTENFSKVSATFYVERNIVEYIADVNNNADVMNLIKDLNSVELLSITNL